MQQFGTITNDDIREYRQFVARLAHRVIIGKPNSVELDDLMQAGMMGLSEALQRFKPLPGVTFRAYASARIIGSMLDELRGYDWAPRSTRHAQREVEKAVQHLQHLLFRAPSDGELAAALSMSLTDFQKLTGLAHSKWVSLEDVLPSEMEAESMDNDAGDDASLLQSPWAIDECSEPSAVLQRRQAYRGLVDAIAVLPERERKVLALYYEEGLKLKQIGAMQGVTESRVCQLLAKTVGKLKSTLDAADRPRQCTADSAASLTPRRRPVRAHAKPTFG
jgi:RNA polymerase sigma factor for flagellar operon FliA